MRIPTSGLSPLSKALIQIKGIDATKFLNGLITSRLLPNVVKKKEHTISTVKKHEYLAETIDINTNWGLIHEDIYDPDNNILVRRDGINSMILNSKGRVVNDCFLYSEPFHNELQEQTNNANKLEDSNYLLEIESKLARKLMTILKLHKLSSKVKIKSQSLFSYYYYNDTLEFDQWLEDLQDKYFQSLNPSDALKSSNMFMNDEVLFNKSIANHVVGFAIDNRIPNFGIKFLLNKPIRGEEKEIEEKGINSPKNSETGLDINSEIGSDINSEISILPYIPIDDLFSSLFKSQFAITPTPPETIQRRRYINGLFETQDAPEDFSLLPFECNLDYTNGLSLEKGCYVGQELTIRTFNNGIIRKRLVPVQFFKLNQENIAQFENQEVIELNPKDEIVHELRMINQSSVTKLNITPLVEEIEDVAGNSSPFMVNGSEDKGPFTATGSVTSPFSSNSSDSPKSDTSNSPFSSPFGTKSTRKRKTSSGKLLSINDNLGFLLVNLSDIEKQTLFKLELPALGEGGVKEIGVKVFQPDWWPQDS